MLTCPNCHHVLAARPCCGVPPQTSQHLCPPTLHHAPPPHPPAHHHHHHHHHGVTVPQDPSSSSSSSSSSVSPSLQDGGGGGTSNYANTTASSTATSVSSLGASPYMGGSSLGPTPLSINSSNLLHQSMTTPHISGHMFHFPSAAAPRVPSFASVCQGACHATCHTAMHTPCVGACHPPPWGAAANPWHWPDSGGHMSGLTSLGTRMHTSGGGIMDDGPNAKSAAVPPDIAKRLNGVKDSFTWTVWDDERVLADMRRALAQSGWYWERLSWRQAESLLQSTSLGTFIVRESADTRFLYSLSVQTERGPTSVRIHYMAGKFRLDSEQHMTTSIPEFSSIISLVEYYIRMNRKLQQHVWVDTQGKMYSPITIRQPLLRSVPTLKHLSRLAINMSLPRSCSAMRLPPALTQYIDEYPYWC